jgi:hypothetical protein
MHTLRFGRKLSLPSTIAIKHQIRKMMADEQIKKSRGRAKSWINRHSPDEPQPRFAKETHLILRQWANDALTWVQLDETRFARPMRPSLTALPKLKIMLATYFWGLGDNLDTALSLPVGGSSHRLSFARERSPVSMRPLAKQSLTGHQLPSQKLADHGQKQMLKINLKNSAWAEAKRLHKMFPCRR